MKNIGNIMQQAVYFRSQDKQTEETKKGAGSRNVPIRQAILQEYNADCADSGVTYAQNRPVYNEHKFYRINYYDNDYGKEVSRYGYMPLDQFIRGIITDCVIAREDTQYQINELIYSDVPTRIFLDLEMADVPTEELSVYGKCATYLVKLIIMIVRNIFGIKDFTYDCDQFEYTKAHRETSPGIWKFSMHVVVLPQYVFDEGISMVRHIIQQAINSCDNETRYGRHQV